MAIYDNLPYTNFHELNLRWLLKKLKELEFKEENIEKIIEQFTGSYSVIAFKTVSDMISSDLLMNGSYALTLGFNTLNDKGSALYMIRNRTAYDVPDNITLIVLDNADLVAELFNTGVNNVKVFNDDLKLALANSEVLYLNNATYDVTVNSTLTKSDIKIIGNNSVIQTTSDVSTIFNLHHAHVEGVQFVETAVDNYTKNVLFTGTDLFFKNCSFESTVTFKGTVEDLTFEDCIFNSWYREIHHPNGILKNLKVTGCEFTRNQNYSTPYQGDSRILIYDYAGVNDPFSETFFGYTGHDIIITNNKFAPCNKRQIHVFNVNNVEICNNVFNASNLDSSQVGGSDDLVSLDFVNYFEISNNYFGHSGENDLDLLSVRNGEVSNNVFEKPYDYYIIDINYSDYIRTFGQSLTDITLQKSADINICNNKIIDSAANTFNIAPCDSVHIYENDITNSAGQIIILFNDFGLHTPSDPSGCTISNIDIGANNVRTQLGDYGRIAVRTNYEYVIDINSGHLSPDICWVETQTVTANTMVYCSPRFPCMHGEAGKLTASGIFRSVTPSLTTWDSANSKSVRRGIDFISNRYNSTAYNTLFYPGDILDKWPTTYVPSPEGNWDNTQTSGSIVLKSW